MINCGRLRGFWSDKMNSSWLEQMFEPKDDAEWLKDLLEKSEITSEQHEWLSDLFQQKAENDKENHADRWWKGISSDVEGSFDPSRVPQWLREHKELKQSAEKTHDLSWSWEWSGKDQDPEKLKERMEEAKKEAAERLEDAKADHADKVNQWLEDTKAEHADRASKWLEEAKADHADRVNKWRDNIVMI